MGQFLGTHLNRIDAKGRVSIPAPFRTALRALSADGAAPLVLRQSHLHACVEGWPLSVFEALAAQMSQMNVFGENHDDMSQVLYADSYSVESDKEGRIVLSDSLVQHAGLSDTVVFMGLGKTFQIWEPQAAERRRAEARERARAQRLTLPAAINGVVQVSGVQA